jgi:hypothetical protein
MVYVHGPPAFGRWTGWVFSARQRLSCIDKGEI